MHLGHGALSTMSKTERSSVGNGPLEASEQEQSTGPVRPCFRKMERKAVGEGTCSKGVRQVVTKASSREWNEWDRLKRQVKRCVE